MCSRIHLKMARIQLHFQSSSMQAPYLFLSRWWCLRGCCTKDVRPTKQFSIKTFPEHKCVTWFPPAANRGEVWWPGGDAPGFFKYMQPRSPGSVVAGTFGDLKNNIHRTSSARVMLTNISFLLLFHRICQGQCVRPLPALPDDEGRFNLPVRMSHTDINLRGWGVHRGHSEGSYLETGLKERGAKTNCSQLSQRDKAWAKMAGGILAPISATHCLLYISSEQRSTYPDISQYLPINLFVYIQPEVTYPPPEFHTWKRSSRQARRCHRGSRRDRHWNLDRLEPWLDTGGKTHALVYVYMEVSKNRGTLNHPF